MSTTEQNLISLAVTLGVRPYWLGKTAKGKLVEYRSLPWKAGLELFVLAQEMGKPETVKCFELRNVKPLMVASVNRAA